MDLWQDLINFFNRNVEFPNVVKVIVPMIFAWITGWLLSRVIPPLVVNQRATHWSPERRRTLTSLIAGTVRTIVYVIVFIFILTLYFPGDSVLTAVGLISAGLGLAARPYISDVISGMSLLFDNYYIVGERVQLTEVIGHVEQVNLRNTYVRADSGELFIIPNGEIRVIRNFTRSAFSLASVQVSVPREQVSACLPVLREAAAQLYTERDDVIEEPLVFSESGLLSTETLLTVKVKARYRHGALVRTMLLTRIHHALGTVGIIAVPHEVPDVPPEITPLVRQSDEIFSPL
jgi:moderate conductance mechanosensitive channel